MHIRRMARCAGLRAASVTLMSLCLSGAVHAAPAPATTGTVAAVPSISRQALDNQDSGFRKLLDQWKAFDRPTAPHVSLPSQRPVDSFRYTSSFGIRSDPFRRTATMHAGIDLAAPTGTPVHATADGIVSRTDYQEVPPRVDYTLTPLGRSLADAIIPLCTWGSENFAEVTSIFAGRDALP